ncbi:uncharacterized protein Gasu_03650 [Galdieria sulphuraria]|uniref:Ribosomal protein mS38 C-terminal domain-containing protein n=1 Tax=Galdieria sulphuraria TaxID=130081 RepID=M2XQT2_GALSU|nr:uncharacterized protein Gasu_03650 [Galdieria sulphuraria]EME32597.1 hypothetical protein Gasu_03650 [Galdieria sulphuraria]|eukprot:XP_005709117.1 hypothetical protein Gasu_03650 [Galdieria sulphuraria]
MRTSLFTLWKHVLLPNVERLSINISQTVKIQDNKMNGAFTNYFKYNRLPSEKVGLSVSWPFDIRKISNDWSTLWFINESGKNSVENPIIQDTQCPLVDMELGSVLKKRKKKMNKHKLKRRRKRDRMKTK